MITREKRRESSLLHFVYVYKYAAWFMCVL